MCSEIPLVVKGRLHLTAPARAAVDLWLHCNELFVYVFPPSDPCL